MIRRDGAALVVAALVVCSAVGAVAAPAGATQQSDGPTPAFVVDLNADGSAQLTLSLVFDLNTDEERAAFRDLQNNETAQNETRVRFRNRIQAVASDAGNATGRNMSVRDPAITLNETDGGDYGVVNLSVTYEGLAAVEGNELTVTELFASGFQPDRRFVVRHPERFGVSSATPAANATSSSRVVYEAGTDLTGFELVLAEPTPTPTPSPTPNVTPTPSPSPTATPSDGGDGGDGGATTAGTTTATSGGGAGFGAFAAVTALVALALLAVRRRDR